jgi:hypothetical protein
LLGQGSKRLCENSICGRRRARASTDPALR